MNYEIVSTDNDFQYTIRYYVYQDVFIPEIQETQNRLMFEYFQILSLSDSDTTESIQAQIVAMATTLKAKYQKLQDVKGSCKGAV